MLDSLLFKRHRAPVGASPGAYRVAAGAHPPRVHAITYSPQLFREHDPDTAEAARSLVAPDRVTWIDVSGLGEPRVLEEFAAQFDLHRLAIADVVNVGQRPKAEEYKNDLFIVVRMASFSDEAGQPEIVWEQVSLFLSRHFVLTFQERPGDCLDPLRARLRDGSRALLRSSGSDYLACMVIDCIVDAYFPVLERFGELLEELEDRVIQHPIPSVLQEVYSAKRALMTFRRAAWPLRDTLNQLVRDRHALISEDTAPYLRDTADHVMQVVEVIETYRELAGSLVDIYLSSVSNKTNEVMRVLTVIATIFIPLTFLAGIYGMNFDTSSPFNLPELGWKFGYLLFWLASIAVAVVLLVMFRRLGWLGGHAGEDSEEEG